MSCDDCTPSTDCPELAAQLAASFSWDLSGAEGGVLTIEATTPTVAELAILFVPLSGPGPDEPTAQLVPADGWITGASGLPLAPSLPLPLVYGPASIYSPTGSLSRFVVSDPDTSCSVELLLYASGAAEMEHGGYTGPAWYSVDNGGTWVQIAEGDDEFVVIVDSETGAALSCPDVGSAVPVTNACGMPLDVAGTVTVEPGELVELTDSGYNVVAAAGDTEVGATIAGAVALVFAATGASDGTVVLGVTNVVVNGPAVVLTAPLGYSLPSLDVTVTGGASDPVAASWTTLVP